MVHLRMDCEFIGLINLELNMVDVIGKYLIPVSTLKQ